MKTGLLKSGGGEKDKSMRSPPLRLSPGRGPRLGPLTFAFEKP
ncbi:MAG TPA: hypothetical protein VEL72_04590 [Ktedonobacteraceae bacterium]|nr:hypothetical protein [Ktedonobacteraceae bacterium]